MLSPTDPIALYMEGASNEDHGKMGFGVLRYSVNPIVCVIDSQAKFANMAETGRTTRSVPIVASVEEALKREAKVLVLGTAPGGGLIPLDWWPQIDTAVRGGMSVVNGLFDLVGPHYPALQSGQWIWDIRQEPAGLANGTALAAGLACRRVLMIGTDMAVGKMTAGLELLKAARAKGIATEFAATGQIGITVTGHGVPLDAVRVDFASGAIEREVLTAADRMNGDKNGLIIIEGQGALIHPSSTANLPLLRGSCPTHLILCHRAGQTAVGRLPNIPIPPLKPYAKLYEDLAEALGTFPRPTTIGVALNTASLSGEESEQVCQQIEQETNWPTCDPVRHGVDRLLSALTGG